MKYLIVVNLRLLHFIMSLFFERELVGEKVCIFAIKFC